MSDDDKTPTHINGSEVSGVGEPNALTGKREISCKDGKQYLWNPETGAIYPFGHPAA